MLSDNANRSISFGVFGSGIFAGLWACGLSVQPIFTIGANDTLPGILGLLLAFDTPLLLPNIIACLFVSTPLLAIGLFGVLTDRARWPKLLSPSWQREIRK